ncbi:hypothetical protein MKZ38_003386 [Zalerion maritima]|uniref:Major facilitator superfamily transporter n=1 Tax=Zalerion maritima TaxID=339359 RepID=A0AAD5RMS6_9PEZI|nr:hypothetical protein MKZ38_003386 [Zalerion maritima]
MEEDPEERGSPSDPPRPRKNPRTAIQCILGFLLLVNLAASLYQLPLNRTIERRLCREYYSEHDPSLTSPDGNVDEELCKIDDVQQSLGRLQGGMETIWIVGDFVMTIPLGFVAEKYGPRPVLWLNMVPRIFMLSWAIIVGYFENAFPTKAILVGPMFSVLGGDCVFNSITYFLASGLTDDHVLRASYFGYMSSISYVVALLGPSLAAASMSVLLWLPFMIGIFLLCLAILVIFRIHPTVTSNHPEADSRQQSQPLLSSPLLKAQNPGNRTKTLPAIFSRIKTLKLIITSHPLNFTLLLLAFLLTSLASSDTKLLAQYISKRYNWTFASAGYLLSTKAIVNFTLLTYVVPKVLRSRHEKHMALANPPSPDRENVTYAKMCLVISVLGAFFISLAAEIWLLFPSLIVYALGSALPIFTLSLLKSPAITPRQSRHQSLNDRRDDGSVDEREGGNPETHIFSIVMLVKAVGSLLGAPLMATLWVKGISIGRGALGLPYMASAACYGIALVVFGKIKVD